MGGVVKSIVKPIEQLGQAITGGIGDVLVPKMPEIPASAMAPAPKQEEIKPAEPAGPGAKASESSAAQNERQRVLASLSRRRTKTLLTGAQGVQSTAKRLLGE